MNFTPRPTATDENGHGTHVASTVAGSGAASGGARKGVAPGARLMNGKVLDQFGSGDVSWAIAAMEWAATNGAEVISMSLQAGLTDGTDPFAQAVNQLTPEPRRPVLDRGRELRVRRADGHDAGNGRPRDHGRRGQQAGRPRRLLESRPAPRQLRDQARHHGSGPRDHRREGRRHLPRQPGRRVLHVARRDVDGDAARLRGVRDPEAGVPESHAGAAQGGARQHGLARPLHRLRAGRRPRRRRAGLLAEGLRRPGAGRLRLLPLPARRRPAGDEDAQLVELHLGARHARPRGRGDRRERHRPRSGADHPERLVGDRPGRRQRLGRHDRRHEGRRAEPLRRRDPGPERRRRRPHAGRLLQGAGAAQPDHRRHRPRRPARPRHQLGGGRERRRHDRLPADASG